MTKKQLTITIAALVASMTAGCADPATQDWSRAGADHGASFDAAGAACGDRWLLDTYRGAPALADPRGKCPNDPGYAAVSFAKPIAPNTSKPAWSRGRSHDRTS